MSALLLRLQSLPPAKRAFLESTLLEQLPERPLEEEAAPEIDSHVLSYSEQRLWFLEQLHPGQPIYTLAAGVRVRGELDAARLQADEVQRCIWWRHGHDPGHHRRGEGFGGRGHA